jgi:hypothetical protein
MAQGRERWDLQRVGFADLRGRERGDRGLDAVEAVLAEDRGHGQQRVHVTVMQQPRELRRLVQRVDRHEHGADPSCRDRGDREIRAVGREQADACALPDARGQEPAREVGRSGVGLAVGDAVARAIAPRRDDELAVAVIGDDGAPHRGHGRHVVQRRIREAGSHAGDLGGGRCRL